MKIEYDPKKDAANIAKHGISLTEAIEFDWDNADFQKDQRYGYGEKRIIATGFIRKREHILVFTMRGETYRIISLRKANKRERKNYEKKT